MKNYRIAVIGLGATGTVLAAALLRKDPKTILVVRSNGMGKTLLKEGIRVSGAISYFVPVENYCGSIQDLGQDHPNLIFISTKTCDLARVLDELATVFKPGTKIVSTHNGLGTEDLIAERFGADSAFRMSLNLGVARIGPGQVKAAFFNPPNHLGAVTPGELYGAVPELADICNLTTKKIFGVFSEIVPAFSGKRLFGFIAAVPGWLSCCWRWCWPRACRRRWPLPSVCIRWTCWRPPATEDHCPKPQFGAGRRG